MQENHERWLELCALAAIEQNHEKLLELTLEINRLLEQKEQRLQKKPAASIPSKANPDLGPKRN